MPDFTVTDEITVKIAKQYNIPQEQVESIGRFYQEFAKGMKLQYLAHLIRTMECRIREVSGNAMFQIICSPVDARSSELGIARAQYYENRYFAVYYHPKTEEKQLRVLLAHELGHLFLVEMLNSTLGKHFDEKKDTEPMASIFGIHAIFDKNEFYYNKTTPFKHKSPDDILLDFSLLHNRDEKILNVS